MGGCNRTARSHRDLSTCQACAKVFINTTHLDVHLVGKGNFYPGFIEEDIEVEGRYGYRVLWLEGSRLGIITQEEAKLVVVENMI